MLPTILLLVPLSAGPATGTHASAQDDNPALTQLRRWMSPFRSLRRRVGFKDTKTLRSLLGDLRFQSQSPSPLQLDTLMEIACLGWEEHIRDTNLESRREYLAEAGMRELGRMLEGQPEIARYLSVEYLVERPRFKHSAQVLCTVLSERHIAATAPGLLAVAQGKNSSTRELAHEALVGWDREDVHRFFIEGLKSQAVTTTRVGRHFQQVNEAPEWIQPEWIERELLQIMGTLYVSPDWREAIRARHLVATVDPRRAVPILIEALALWDRRQASGDSSKRVRHDIAEALKLISGRSIGPDVASWNRWWSAVLEGRIPLIADRIAAGDAPTVATFFGLRPVTDSVAFIIDRSGSMRTNFGTGSRSRHLEAVDQAIRFLEKSGVDTRFSLTIFSDANRPETWRSKLSPASEANLRSARNWLGHKEPDGGTWLFPGIAKALQLTRDGGLLPGRVKVDTVIVLCDGNTNDGPSWVEPWLSKYNEAAQLVFHCVQIGHAGDGTLQLLAKLSGGQFLRVEG